MVLIKHVLTYDNKILYQNGFKDISLMDCHSVRLFSSEIEAKNFKNRYYRNNDSIKIRTVNINFSFR